MVTPAALRSRLLVGRVMHRRMRHASYAFTHRVWYVAMDLDELEEMAMRPLLAYQQPALLELRDGDHLRRPGLGLRASVAAHLREANASLEAARVTLVTYPRVAGYVFNPVSFYLCHDEAGMLRHVIAEVSNTHGGREVYDFFPETAGEVFRSSADKRMYVSPFIGPEARYELAVTESTDRLTVTIREYEDGVEALFARVELTPRPLTRRNLLGALALDPLVPLKTIALIGWHAARLWWSGVKWRRYVRG